MPDLSEMATLYNYGKTRLSTKLINNVEFDFFITLEISLNLRDLSEIIIINEGSRLC